MSEKKETKAAAKPETNANADSKKSGNASKSVTVAPVAKVFKAKWTLERCKRYARRFTSETVWASASPASYKAAVAHGWRDQCVAEMNGATATRKAA